MKRNPFFLINPGTLHGFSGRLDIFDIRQLVFAGYGQQADNRNA